jgi:hypothetical protein
MGSLVPQDILLPKLKQHPAKLKELPFFDSSWVQSEAGQMNGVPK